VGRWVGPTRIFHLVTACAAQSTLRAGTLMLSSSLLYYYLFISSLPRPLHPYFGCIRAELKNCAKTAGLGLSSPTCDAIHFYYIITDFLYRLCLVSLQSLAFFSRYACICIFQIMLALRHFRI